MNISIESCLSSSIGRYLELKRALGRDFANERRVLELVDQFIGEAGAADLTQAEFERWCKTQLHLSSGVRRDRMRIVRNFCLYRRRTEPNCFVPDAHLFPAPHQVVQPHIFSEGEIARLLQATAKLPTSPRYVMRPQVLRLAVVLLYTTGLRRGELLRLTLADYDQHERTLLVRDSKFHKSRYLPLSADATAELDAYLIARHKHHLPMLKHSPLLWSGRATERAFSASALGDGLRELCRLAEVRKADGRLPRVHDYRHSFALQALLRWYRSGVDIQAKLPLLATYMGHVSIASTEYYLPLIPELALEASNRFCSRYGALVRPLPEGRAS
jgi:integrase/recombinase XerD